MQLYFAYNQGDPATLDNINKDVVEKKYQAFRCVQAHAAVTPLHVMRVSMV